MSKFSLFTIFLSSVIVVIIAELLVNQYVKDPYSERQLQANLLNAQLTQESQQAMQFSKSGQPVQNPSQVSSNASSQSTKRYKVIGFETIKEAGFKDYDILQVVPFNGILFENIDLRDFKSVPVIQQNLMQNNRVRMAVFYEFQSGDGVLANEIYRYLIEKSRSIMGATVNETNQFGNGSFYINFLDRKEYAFLVVKQKENVYALSYRKDYHPLIKQLISLLY